MKPSSWRVPTRPPMPDKVLRSTMMDPAEAARKSPCTSTQAEPSPPKTPVKEPPVVVIWYSLFSPPAVPFGGVVHPAPVVTVPLLFTPIATATSLF